MPTRTLQIRVPQALYDAFERAAQERGGTVSAAGREAIREWIDRERVWKERDDLEARIAATMSRVMKDTLLVRNDMHLLMAFFDAFLRSYYLHTPPVPRDAIDAASVSAHDRYEKLMKQIPSLLQEGSGISMLADGARS